MKKINFFKIILYKTIVIKKHGLDLKKKQIDGCFEILKGQTQKLKEKKERKKKAIDTKFHCPYIPSLHDGAIKTTQISL